MRYIDTNNVNKFSTVMESLQKLIKVLESAGVDGAVATNVVYDAYDIGAERSWFITRDIAARSDKSSE